MKDGGSEGGWVTDEYAESGWGGGGEKNKNWEKEERPTAVIC